MRVLKNRMFQVLMAVLTLTACSDTELVTKVQEGLPCTVQLTLAVPEQENVSMTRATAAQETTVEKVALFFYKKSQPDEVPVVVEITEMGTPTKETDTHYLYAVTVTADGLYSGEWYLYAVANYDKLFVSAELTELKNLTKAQMDQYLTGGSGELDIVETAILMSGKYSDGTGEILTLKPGENILENSTLKLRRLIAKNIFTFVNGEGVTFTPVSYSIYNNSTSSTLMERSGWTGVNEADPGTVGGYSAANNSLKTKENIPITDNTFTFYTQENVQPSNREIQGFYNKREERNDDRSFKNAPANATYVVVKGTYKGPGKDVTTDGTAQVTGNVEYTIHLGDFSEENEPDEEGGDYKGDYNGNFTVRRNVKYTYKVTVNGVNNIIVEATTDNEIQPGAEGDIIQENSEVNVTLDAHYEQVLLGLDISAGLDNFALMVNTPYTTKTYRTISEIPDQASEYDESGNYVFDGADLSWVQFAKPKTTTTFQSYQDVCQKMCGIKQLLEELSDSDETHALKGDDGMYYVAAYVNEYYYKGEDLSKFVNAANREMILASSVSTSADGHSTYTVTPIFSLSQRSIKSPFNLSSGNPMGIETIEEGPMYKLNSAGEGDGGTTSENDRDNVKKTGESLGNGWENMAVTDNTYFCIVGKKWADFIDESNHGYIKGQLGQKGTGEDILKSGYQNPLYQMLTRNRDLDGDGVIDVEELRWYVPARNQCMDLWMAYDALPTEARLDTKNRLYLTSTAGVNRTWWADEGVSFGYWKSTDKLNSEEDKGKNAVRVVRGLRNYDAETGPIAGYDANNHIISMTGLSSLCLRSGKITGEYSAHLTGATEDKLPKAFEFSTASKTTTANEAATGTLGSDGWRVPNERELGMILMKNPDLFSGYSCFFARTQYTESRYYYYNATKKFITTSTEVTSATSGGVFLVRDVDESTSDSGSDSETSTTKTYDSSYSNNGVGFGVQ